MKDLQRERDDLIDALKKHQEERRLLSLKIEEIKQEYEALRKKDEAHFDELMKKKSELEIELQKRLTIINEKDYTIKTLT